MRRGPTSSADPSGVPCHFVGRDLHGARVTLRRGQLWPIQDRRVIRGFSEAFGVQDDGRAWHEIPFNVTLVAPDAATVDIIVAQDMSLDEATAYLARRRGQAA